MSAFNISIEGDLLRVGFGVPATNVEIVKDAKLRLDEMKASGELAGGTLLKINGAASLPCAFAIAHTVTHLYGAVAVWDPKLQKYIVCVAHNATHKVGDEII